MEKERLELLERRGMPEYALAQNSQIAPALSRRERIAPVFYHLSRLQLAVLRWLSHQPGYQAAWPDLTAALQGRVPEETLLAELGNLRLWGVLDFLPAGSGFVATFPSVVTAAPQGRRPGLAAHVNALGGEQLRAMAPSTNVLTLTTPRKDRDAGLKQLVCEPEHIRQRIEALSEPARAFFDWVRSVGGVVDQAQIHNRTGGWSSRGSLLPGSKADPQE